MSAPPELGCGRFHQIEKPALTFAGFEEFGFVVFTICSHDIPILANACFANGNLQYNY